MGVNEEQILVLGAQIVALTAAEKALVKTYATNFRYDPALTEVRRLLRQRRAEMRKMKKQVQGRLF